jgi:WD40 repeat protein
MAGVVLPEDGGTLKQISNGENLPGFDSTGSADGTSLAIGGPARGGAPIRVLNLTKNQISVLPGSAGLYSARWSPDGRYIAALSANSARVLVFNVQSQSWIELAKGNMAIRLGLGIVSTSTSIPRVLTPRSSGYAFVIER